MIAIVDAEPAANGLLEFARNDELCDGELAHGNDQLRLEDFNFPLQPWRAIGDLERRWHTITSPRFLSRKAATDGRHVDAGAKDLFRNCTVVGKPAEEGLACRPGERFAKHRLFFAGRLADQHHFAPDRAARNRGSMHVRAQRTGPQLLHMQTKLIRFRIFHF